MTPLFLSILLTELLGANAQISWGVSIIQNGQPEIYYLSDEDPYSSLQPTVFFLSEPSNGEPGMMDAPPGVEINPEAEIIDTEAVISKAHRRTGSSRPSQKHKRHIKGYEQPRPEERQHLPPLAPSGQHSTKTPSFDAATPQIKSPRVPHIASDGPKGTDNGCNDNSVPMDASYDFSYSTDDAERKEKSDQTGNIEGSYSYIADDGVRREVKYSAGAGKGFVVTGDIYPTGSESKGVSVPKSKGYPAPRPDIKIPGPSVKSAPRIPAIPRPVRPKVPVSVHPTPYPEFGVRTKSQSPKLPPQNSIPAPIPGVKTSSDDYEDEHPGDASYDFSYKTGDHEHSAKSDTAGNVQGSYSFIGLDGVQRRVDYIAGADTGFVATGEHLPKPGDFSVSDTAPGSGNSFTPIYTNSIPSGADDGQRSILTPVPHIPQNPVYSQRKPTNPQTPLPLRPQTPPPLPIVPRIPALLPPQSTQAPLAPLPIPQHPKTPEQIPQHPKIPLPVPPQVPIKPEVPLPLPSPIPEESQRPLPLTPHIPSPQVPVHPETHLPPQVPVHPVTHLPPQVPVHPETHLPPQVPVHPETHLPPQVPVHPETHLPPQVPLIPHGGQKPLNLNPPSNCDNHDENDDSSSPADRSYAFDFSSDDQARKEVSDSEGNVQGSYSFVGPDGIERRVEYEAGPGIGFIAKGDHLPQPVEPENPTLSQGASFYPLPQANHESIEPEYGFGNDPADSSYSFSYATDSHSRSESADPYGNVWGSFMFIDDDGLERKVDYKADKQNGFTAEGAHLPAEISKAMFKSGVASPFFEKIILDTNSANEERLQDDGLNFRKTFKTNSRLNQRKDNDSPQAAFLTAGSDEEPEEDFKLSGFESLKDRGNTPLKSFSHSGLSNGVYSFSFSSDDNTKNETSDNFKKVENNFSFVGDDGAERKDSFEKNFGSGTRKVNIKKADKNSLKSPEASALTGGQGKVRVEGKHEAPVTYLQVPNMVSNGMPYEELPLNEPPVLSPYLLPPHQNYFIPNALSFANRLYRQAQVKQRH